MFNLIFGSIHKFVVGMASVKILLCSHLNVHMTNSVSNPSEEMLYHSLVII